MIQHEAFLRSIIETPGDDGPRLIYADWLDENGDPARAEFIRVQCRLATADEDAPERRDLQRREYELLADHWGDWAAPLVGRVRHWRFRRGFVEQVKLEAGQFLKEPWRLLDFAPIQELEVRHPTPEEMRALLASKHIRRITRLNLDHAELGDAGASQLADSPNLARLTGLSLRFTKIGTDGLLALARSPHLRSLQSLNVTANDLPRDALARLAAACRLPLERLSWDDEMGPDGMRDLSASPLAGRLKALHLRATRLGREGLHVLAESSAFTRLEELSINTDVVTTAGAAALAAAPFLRRLTSLELSNTSIRDEGVAELGRQAQAASLRRLTLSMSKTGSDGVLALANSPLCDALIRLDLSRSSIGDCGVKAVANSPRLGELRRLDLSHCGVTWHGAKALLSSPHLDRLTCLRLEENRIGRKAFDALRVRLGDRLYHEHFDDGLDGPEIIRRVKAEPPRCLRGLGARPDTELIRRFSRDRLDPADYAGVAFELTHPDPRQKAVLLGYEDTRGYDLFFSPYAVRWEPSGEQREFFDAEQHGHSGELDFNCTIVGSGARTPWKCGRRGCRDHAFIVTFIYCIVFPARRYLGRDLPFADQFDHIDLDAYCASQDRVIEVASFECK